MKRMILVSVGLAFLMTCIPLLAQQAPAAAGGQRGVPAATGPMLDVANKISDAINKQDAATLQKMLAPDAVYLDEDGHAPPVQAWIGKLTGGTPAKQFAISNTHGQMWSDVGWVSFNYTL